MENWNILSSENLPEENVLVWVKRKNGSIYLACRNNKEFSENEDASRDCHWYGKKLDDAFKTNPFMKWEPVFNFSDTTVLSWKYIDLPK